MEINQEFFPAPSLLIRLSMKGMNKLLLGGGILAGIIALSTAVPALAAEGFDEFGYNYTARVFSGSADGVDRTLDDAVWGDSTYANDHLVMKWSKAWDEARFNGANWTPEAWVNNEWNGMLPDGSRTTEIVKIIWVGSGLEDSPYWREGGYPIWGEFEVLMDQGISGGEHQWYAHAVPTGYGVVK